MKSSHISIGAVFDLDWPADPVRVVAFNNDVVMYDAWWPHNGAWGMAKLLGTFSYYRLERNYFQAHSRYLRADPLTEQEMQVHRSELPFSFGQHEDLSWYEQWNEGVASPRAHPSNNIDSVLNAPTLYLEPFGPRDSSKPAVLVEAKNGRFFTEKEVLLLAKTVQSQYLGHTRLTDGVGIYRSGIRKRLPSYYLWGAKSRLETGTKNAA